MKLRYLLIISTIVSLLTAGVFSADINQENAGSSRIYLQSGVFDPLESEKAIPEEFIYSGAGGERVGIYLVQYRKITGRPEVEMLEKSGTEILAYIPENTYLVEVSESDDSVLKGSKDVRWYGIFEPYYKVQSRLHELCGQEGDTEIIVEFFDGPNIRRAVKTAGRFGGKVLRTWEQVNHPRMVVRIAKEELSGYLHETAALPDVAWIEEKAEFVLANDNTVWITQGGLSPSGETPLYDAGLTGEGQVVGFADTGIDADACYFYDFSEGLVDQNTGPDPSQRKILSYRSWYDCGDDWDGQGHGSHVGGIIAGDNYENGIHDFDDGGMIIGNDGMAPGAKLVVQDVAIEEFLVGIPEDLTLLFSEAQQDGAVMHSDSWTAESYQLEYLSYSRDVDEFMWNNKEFLIVFAAGNYGPLGYTLASPGNAKNCLTVGASDSAYTYSTSTAEDVGVYSSHGPCLDDRLKPDLTAPGGASIYIYSAETDLQVGMGIYNCYFVDKIGTSMAGPCAAGNAALTRQYFMDGYYPTGSPEPLNARTPSNSLLKAVLINSCENMTGQYTGDDGWFDPPSPRPTAGQGWGRLTMDNALCFDGDSRLMWIRDEKWGIDQGETHAFDLLVTAGSEPLTVTLVWTDYPAAAYSEINLVNDLDLTVTEVNGGTTYVGNEFSGGWSVSGGGPDRRNPVECVAIQYPVSGGQYRIQVSAYNVPMPVQPYSIVVSGALDFSNGMIYFDEVFYGCDHSADIELMDSDLAGTGSHVVHVFSDSDPTGENITLNEIATDSGNFGGTFHTTTDSSPPAGYVRVQHGDSITVEYMDADDGFGNTNVLKTDVSQIDCAPPVISEVELQVIADDYVYVRWETDELSNSVVRYGTADPPGLTAQVTDYTTEHLVKLSGLTECTDYIFEVESSDKLNNSSVDDNSGAYYSFRSLGEVTAFTENFDSDPGWEIFAGEWTFGTPAGQGGGPGGFGPDPDSGYTGSNVYGNNLLGNYPLNLQFPYMLYSENVDCRPGILPVLRYWRWLGVEGWDEQYGWQIGDKAQIGVETDDEDWQAVWTNPRMPASLDDQEWVYHEVSLQNFINHEDNVSVTWSIGPTDNIFSGCGWNIDDVEIAYLIPCELPNLWIQSVDYDDSSGNGNGVPGVGETVNVAVTLHNFADPPYDANNLTAVLSTDDPYVDILDDTATFGTVPAQGSAQSQPPHFQFFIDWQAPPTGRTITFKLNWTSDETNGHFYFDCDTDYGVIPEFTPVGLGFIIILMGGILWFAVKKTGIST